ncbi:MAG TPA: metallophosphoesterase [Polyangiaceae bacterium]|nr:metallophosphoesterase [Polyangiaceae bacterium]
MKRAIFLTLSGLLVFSCLRPSDDRAERDLEIGQAEIVGTRVTVQDGLAAVRSLSDQELVLWGSAPGFRLELASASARELSVEVQNCLPDAELRAAGSSGSVDALGDQGVPTRKLWRVHAPAGSMTLELTTPDATDATPFRFALMSDVQEAIDDVQDVFQRVNGVPRVRFLLGAGDLTEQGTREQLERFQRELLTLQVPYFTTLGNHELGTSPALYHDYFGRGSFQFRFRGVYFTLLDSASASLDPLVYEWLDGWLDAARRDVHVVAMHIPPIDPIGVRNGSWASRSEAAKLLGKLGEGRVDLTLYGHVHSYYSFDNAGIPAFISGGGGAIPERFDRIGRHFMVFDIDAAQGVLEQSVIKVD